MTNQLPEDPRDRLLELALEEKLGGATPPDLSKQILAAAPLEIDSPTTTLASAGSTPITFRSRARFVLAASLFLALCGTLVYLSDAEHRETQRVAQNSHDSNKVSAVSDSAAASGSDVHPPLSESEQARREGFTESLLAVESTIPPEFSGAEVAPILYPDQSWWAEMSNRSKKKQGQQTSPPAIVPSTNSLNSLSPDLQAILTNPNAMHKDEARLRRPGVTSYSTTTKITPYYAALPGITQGHLGLRGAIREGVDYYGIGSDGATPSHLPPSESQYLQLGVHVKVLNKPLHLGSIESTSEAWFFSNGKANSQLASLKKDLSSATNSFGYYGTQRKAWGVDHDGDGVRNDAELSGRWARIRDLRQQVQWRQQVQRPEGVGPGSRGDQYALISENDFLEPTNSPLSTFSIDVDTASYTNVRQYLTQSQTLPPPDAVRIEELVNYFNYDYDPPSDRDVGVENQNPKAPFAASMEVASCPWAPQHRLVRIGLKGREIEQDARPQSNLVFLLDVSGSMNQANKLPLLVQGMKLLARQLGENDRVAIVVYASSEGLVLPSTSGFQQEKILAALDQLKAGGSTAGGAGIELAYKLAQENFIKDGTNRVILCTDGDFNVGVTDTGALARLAEEKAKSGVFLTVLGFGRGNLNDQMMESISNRGNGNYHYIDNLTEARKVLVEELGGTLITIAKDVKIQVEFNPKHVAAYRLIGYENRIMAAQDFNDDTKDAGEIGAGHTVTALYEIMPPGTMNDPSAREQQVRKRIREVEILLKAAAETADAKDSNNPKLPQGPVPVAPADSVDKAPEKTEATGNPKTPQKTIKTEKEIEQAEYQQELIRLRFELKTLEENEKQPKAPSVDPLDFQKPGGLTAEAKSDLLLNLKVRYKQPDGDKSTLLKFPLADNGQAFSKTSKDFQFASAVASFGMLLRGSQYAGGATYGTVLELAEKNLGPDKHGYRQEFVELVRKAKALSGE